ncbi:MAG: hypothetical protein SFX72_22870 [Isosphaeraceae bacterium]|nr:hypothetical protein [Isosphaeraceae bacterium]
MCTSQNEHALTLELIVEGHLDVPKRRALPGGRVKGSVIASVLAQLLRSGSPISAWWLPDDSMIGCVVSYRGCPDGRVEWSYSGVEGELAGIREFATLDAAVVWLVDQIRSHLGAAIDGIPVDWSD